MTPVIHLKKDLLTILRISRRAVLKGIGGFTIKYKPAEIDSKNNVIRPPKGELAFASFLNYDDDSITQYYLNRYPEQTLEVIEKLVTDQIKGVKKILDESGMFLFEGMGTLKIDKEGNYLFEPVKNLEVLPESFGLEDIDFEENKLIPESRGISKTQLFLLLISSLLVLGGAVSVIFFTPELSSFVENWKNDRVQSDNSGKNTIKIGSFKNPNIDTSITIDNSKSETEILEDKLDQSSEISNALKYEEKPIKTEPATNYYIVAGSFTIKENAVKLQEELTNKGYTPDILKSSENKFRVTLKSSTNRSQALKDLQNYRKALPELEVWLLSL